MFKRLLSNPWTYTFILALALVIYARHNRKPQPVVTPPAQPANVTVTPVATKEITTREIPILTKDPADAKRIAEQLAVIKALNSRVDVLTASRAESTSNGTLTPTVVHDTVTNTVTQQVEVPAPFNFSDYRLNVASDGKAVTYQLHQAFLIVSSTGRHKDGSRVVDVALYEVGPGDQRTAIPSTTKAVVVDETANHFLTGFNVQGGALFTRSVKGFVADVQWLKYGRTNNPGDLKWAFASPAVLIASEVKELGVLPVSINLAAHVKHQPFTNVWLSPYLGIDLNKSVLGGASGVIRFSRVGVAGTFTW